MRNDDAARALREVGADILRLKQTIADLNAENERLRVNHRSLQVHKWCYAEIERLRTALQFYADDHSWMMGGEYWNRTGMTEAAHDGGQKARAALNGEKE